MRNTLMFSILIMLTSCGSTGHISFYEFNTSKYVIEQDLYSVIKDDTFSLSIKKADQKIDIFYNCLEIQFKKAPKESYLIAFSCDSLDWKSSPNYSTLELIGIMQGESWSFASRLSKKEQSRMQFRFEKEILSKLKDTYHKGVNPDGVKQCLQ